MVPFVLFLDTLLQLDGLGSFLFPIFVLKMHVKFFPAQNLHL